MVFQVQGDPHPWPRDGMTPIGACALLVVDMQEDYCSPGYYMAQAGYDTSAPPRACRTSGAYSARRATAACM